MYSFNWPNMFDSVTAMLVEDKAAIRSNLRLLLSSERRTLFGDPYYGIALKRFLFEPTSLIADLIIDEIHTTILTFMPQLFVRRDDIIVETDHINVYVRFTATFKMDNTSDLYVINLTNVEE